MLKEKYAVIDCYEDREIIGKSETLKGANKIAKDFYNDTDGECYLFLGKLNSETNKYRINAEPMKIKESAYHD